MICKQCGANVSETCATCPGCGAPLGDPWAPPSSDSVSRPEEGEAPFGYSTGGAPRKVSLFSKLAMVAAIVVPPLGLVLGIVATMAARKVKKRPGNLSVALASIFTSMHVGVIWFGVLAAFWAESSRFDDSYYDDPYLTDPLSDPALSPSFDTDPAGLEANPELQKLLEELIKLQPDGGVGEVPADPGL
ncbi:MAG: zinc ribbon domain-containing protein [Deltaproteobacteria bacterium]|nr:zinc ribbon domain-containing protein [Deltaproteobacteria bacterium]